MDLRTPSTPSTPGAGISDAYAELARSILDLADRIEAAPLLPTPPDRQVRGAAAAELAHRTATSPVRSLLAESWLPVRYIAAPAVVAMLAFQVAYAVAPPPRPSFATVSITHSGGPAALP